MLLRRTVASRAIGQGLAKIEPTSPNLLIAYSAKAGSTASDGDGKNSPFTTALARHLTTPGLDVRRAFGFVRDDVLKSTGNRQEPFVYGSLGGQTMSLVPPAAKPVDPETEARVDYELAAQVGTKEAWDSFLASHPNGLYANLARAQTSKLAAANCMCKGLLPPKQAIITMRSIFSALPSPAIPRTRNTNLAWRELCATATIPAVSTKPNPTSSPSGSALPKMPPSI